MDELIINDVFILSKRGTIVLVNASKHKIYTGDSIKIENLDGSLIFTHVIGCEMCGAASVDKLTGLLIRGLFSQIKKGAKLTVGT